MRVRPRHLAAAMLLLGTVACGQLPGNGIQRPSGIAYDAAGNLYFADADRHQVFEATLGGQLLVVAGNGTQGFSGDDGAATAAQLNSPQALAIGTDGTLYIADTGNHRVRAVIAGTISTIAGTGKAGYGGDNGPAKAAVLDSPNALALDVSGALLLCDSGNHRVRRIASGVIATIAGNGTQGFGGDNGPTVSAALDTPSGLAVAASGTVYVADTHNHRVRAVSASGIITTFAGTGKPGYSGDGAAAVLAQLDGPRGLAIDASGGLLIADADNQRVRFIDANGTITTLAGVGTQGVAADAKPALTVALNGPRTVGLSGFGSPVLADAANHTLRLLAADGKLYLPAALVSRSSTVSVSAPASAAFGQETATVTVSGSASVPLGTVQLLQNGSAVATGTLVGGTATFPLTTMSAGSYTFSASYLGDGINPAATSPAISVNIDRAATSTTAQPPVQNTYATLPLLLNANVTSTTKGTPTGTVNFIDTSNGTVPVATAQLTNGIASSVYLAPTAGAHAIVANYLGDNNFAPSTSPAVTASIQALPDFTLATTGSTAQTVTAGFVATYSLTVAPQAAPFTGAVSMSVSGLPAGATASFAPPQVVPGAASVPTVLSVQTLAAPLVQVHSRPSPYAFALLGVPLLLFFRCRRSGTGLSVAFTLGLISLMGCGTRINQPPSASAGVYNLTVRATGTNLAGATVVHTVGVVLNIR